LPTANLARQPFRGKLTSRFRRRVRMLGSRPRSWPASDLERWADQGLDMVVPPIDSGPVAFTHLHDACPT